MATTEPVVVEEVIDEINMEENPLDIQNSYSTKVDTTTGLQSDLLGNSEEEKTIEQDGNTPLESAAQDQNLENETRHGSGSHNYLDVLSKACENISEVNESNGKELPYTENDEYTTRGDEVEGQHYNIEESLSDHNDNNEIGSGFFEDYVGDEVQQGADASRVDTNSTEHGLRKSGRKRRPRPQSPDVGTKSNVNKRPRVAFHLKVNRAKKTAELPFKCDLCGSPNITDPTRRGNRPKMSTNSPSPRHKKDPETGKILTLCNACGLSFNRPKKARQKTVFDPEAKQTYLEEARQFATSLAEGLEEQDAVRLYCPRFKTFPCACLQKYILADGNMDESRQRALQLINLLKQSKLLSKQKCYSTDEPLETSLEQKGRKGRNIGLGNGQRKSKAFEDFVLNQRKYLREELKLCEQGTQRVLNYSNNFLHKKLKTDPAKPLRVERQKGQAVLGKLKPIEELPSEACCVDKCVSMALTHSKLLQQWRSRSASGQAEARRVLAEMLTPSGGARSNCYKFISWVTGCSHSTIGRVNEQMKKTGGDREPPVHGLINWWKENPKPKKVKSKTVPHSTASSSQPGPAQPLPGGQLQSISQIGILQAAANSAGISSTILPSSQLQGNPQVITINPAHLTQLSVSSLNLPTTQSPSTARQVILTPTQATKLQIQQLQQQQQQLQFQTMQLQQQLQQQMQQEQQQQQQQLQTQTVQQQTPDQTQSIQIQIPSQVISAQDGTCLTLASSQEFPSASFATTLHPVSQVQTVIPSNGVTTNLSGATQVQQATPVGAETFLSTDTLQIINSGQIQAVAPHVLTLQCSTEPTATQAVPVSLIQTPVSLSL